MNQSEQNEVPPDAPLDERTFDRWFGVDMQNLGPRSAPLVSDLAQSVPENHPRDNGDSESSIQWLTNAVDVFLWIAAAAVIMMVIYLIYHSLQMFGVVA